jgi:hypothetical protein
MGENRASHLKRKGVEFILMFKFVNNRWGHQMDGIKLDMLTNNHKNNKKNSFSF